jgi:hypothetical protein
MQKGWDSPVPMSDAVDWKDNYIKHVHVILYGWKWNAADKDDAVLLEDNNLRAMRAFGGHNPSVRGDKCCTGVAVHYFEVVIEKLGDWLSFGFASEGFNVSSKSHTGKGAGSCAYYSDSATYSIFCPGYPDQRVRKIGDGDHLGCLIDTRTGRATFCVNGKMETTLENPSWSNHSISNLSSDAKSTGWKMEDQTAAQHTDVKLFPALSVGTGAVVAVVPRPKIPSLLTEHSMLTDCGCR